MRTLALAFLASAGAAILATGALAFAPEGVVTSSRVELEPAAGEGYLAFSREVRGHPELFNLIVDPDGSAAFRANPSGTAAFAGNFDGTTLVYSQAPRLGRSADIKLFDVVTKDRSSPPGVNTRRHEGGPSISGDWLAFLRARRVSLDFPRRLLLRNLTTSEQRELDFGGAAYLQGGGVAGDFVAWTKCPHVKQCSTWRYQISTESKTRLPNPQDKSQFAVSITADGTVYYAESSTILCSARKVVRFYRQPLVDPRELLATLARGKDTAVTSPLVALDGSVELFFDRFNATCEKSDIYKIPIPAPGP